MGVNLVKRTQFLAAPMLLPIFLLFSTCFASRDHWMVSGRSQIHGQTKGISLESLETEDLNYNVKIDTHYAITNVLTKYRNAGPQAIDAKLSVTLPDGAFISGFEMTVNGLEFEGVVLPKEQAQEVFDQAVDAGQSAGLISESSENVFDFTVNVESNAFVMFSLTYEQLLTKRFGWYEYTLEVLTRELQFAQARVNIFVSEENGISRAEVPSPVYPEPQLEQPTDNTLHVNYPSPGSGLRIPLGDQVFLTLRYKINPPPQPVGTFVTDQSGDYFVHLFSPPELDPFDKAVIFVLDRSGSMVATKFNQLQQAAHIIVDESFSQNDYFNFLYFNEDMFPWSNILRRATDENKADAHGFIDDMTATGLTDIEEALVLAIQMLKNSDLDNTYAHQIIFLTDGQPTQGVTSPPQIQTNVRAANTDGFSIYGLGLGNDLDYELLRAISLENNGFERRIDENDGVEAALVLFVEEIDTAVISNIQMSYSSSQGQVNDITKTSFSLLFEDSEVLVAGKIPSNGQVITIEADGIVADGSDIHYEHGFNVEFSIQAADARGSEVDVEQIWAFLTIRELQEKIDVLSGRSDSQAELEELEAEILRMSVMYGFVTSYTSLVVVPHFCLIEPDVTLCAEESGLTYEAAPEKNPESDDDEDGAPPIRTGVDGSSGAPGGGPGDGGGGQSGPNGGDGGDGGDRSPIIIIIDGDSTASSPDSDSTAASAPAPQTSPDSGTSDHDTGQSGGDLDLSIARVRRSCSSYRLNVCISQRIPFSGAQNMRLELQITDNDNGEVWTVSHDFSFSPSSAGGRGERRLCEELQVDCEDYALECEDAQDLQFEIDSNNDVNESDESNNVLQKSFDKDNCGGDTNGSDSTSPPNTRTMQFDTVSTDSTDDECESESGRYEVSQNGHLIFMTTRDAEECCEACSLLPGCLKWQYLDVGHNSDCELRSSGTRVSDNQWVRNEK